MSEWSPDSDDSFRNDDGENDADDAEGVARVMTLTPVAVRLVPTPHPRAPEGHVVFRALGAVDGDLADDSPVLAQGSLPQPTFTAVQESDLFAKPVPLMLTAREDEGGIRAILAALVPAGDVERVERAARAAEEPWLGSLDEAPTNHRGAGAPEDEDVLQLVPFVLGVVLRFPENRQHPESLDDEAVDLLATLLSGGAMDADRKRVENLLKSL
ncbi:MAG: hypothetical protein ACLGIK_09670 [Gemmatimonadota bacterium]